MTPLFILTRIALRLATFVAARLVLLQVVFGLGALALGFYGFQVVENKETGATRFANDFFKTLQLITLQFPTTFEKDIPWQLQTARLLLPVVAVMASFQVLIGNLTRPLRLALMPYMKDHIVVFGNRQLTEGALKALAARGKQIVVVAPGIEDAQRDALEGEGMTVYAADPRLSATLKHANIRNAAAFLITGDNDLDNVNLAALAVTAARERDRELPEFVLGVLVDSEAMAAELDVALDNAARSQRLRYYRLCPDRDGLRLDLARFAPALRRENLSEPGHILVCGLAGRWEQSLWQLIVSAQDHPDTMPLVSLFLTADEAGKLDAWRAAYPDINKVVRLTAINRERELPPDDALKTWREGAGAPHLAIVMQEDARGVTTALGLRRPQTFAGTEAAPILVRQSREDRLFSALGQAQMHDRNLSDMAAFGGLIRAETIERVLDRKGDELAIALHLHYRNVVQTMAVDSPAALAEWDQLPENLREANRASAAHIPILFAACGLRIAEASDPREEQTLGAAEIEALARIEHRRWMTDRIEHGWRAGTPRDNARRIHPSIVAYEDLSEDDKEKDRQTVLALMASVKKTGRKLVRR